MYWLTMTSFQEAPSVDLVTVIALTYCCVNGASHLCIIIKPFTASCIPGNDICSQCGVSASIGSQAQAVSRNCLTLSAFTCVLLQYLLLFMFAQGPHA